MYRERERAREGFYMMEQPRLNHHDDRNCSIQKTRRRSRSRGDVILKGASVGGR